MCHRQRIKFFGDMVDYTEFSNDVEGILFPGDGRRIAIVPDIYGLTDFYIGYASYLAKQGAEVFLINPWHGLGGTPTLSRDEAFVRRAKLQDKAYCDNVEAFIKNQKIDAIIGFCIGGNFVLELANRGYNGTNISIYPLPWGMDNQDKISPAFEYMSSLSNEVNIFMGAADHLAGPDNIKKIETICASNENLALEIYDGSNHGFFTDIDGDDLKLRDNAHDAIIKINNILFKID